MSFLSRLKKEFEKDVKPTPWLAINFLLATLGLIGTRVLHINMGEGIYTIAILLCALITTMLTYEYRDKLKQWRKEHGS